MSLDLSRSCFSGHCRLCYCSRASVYYTARSQYFKKLTATDDLWEVRAQHGGDTFRLLGFFDGPRLLVVVSGFAKKAERVPRQEVALAEERRREYLGRKGKDE